MNYRTKGFRDPRRTRPDPNPTPKWSKNGHFWGSEPPDLVRSMLPKHDQNAARPDLGVWTPKIPHFGHYFGGVLTPPKVPSGGLNCRTKGFGQPGQPGPTGFGPQKWSKTVNLGVRTPKSEMSRVCHRLVMDLSCQIHDSGPQNRPFWTIFGPILGPEPPDLEPARTPESLCTVVQWLRRVSRGPDWLA